MELASSDLLQLLSNQGEKASISQRFTLCLHIAAGLDAIHECDLAHGDLKPGNVLVFDRAGVLVAKLADFGLFVGGSEPHLPCRRLVGTPGWQAPEVEQGRLLTPQELVKADNYSFGLTAWSTVFGSGKCPPGPSWEERESWIRRDLDDPESKVLPPVLCAMKHALGELLIPDSTKRPTRLGGLFNVQGISDDSGVEEADDRLSILHPVTVINTPNDNLVPRFMWELPCLPDCLGPSLASRFMTDPDGMTPVNLFLLFLKIITKPTAYEEVSAIDVLLKSASQGFHPAQAIIPTILEYYQTKPPFKVEPHIRGWLEAGIASGSIVGREHLKLLDSEALNASINRFRDNGGYGRHYYTISHFSSLHALATYGTVMQLRDFLNYAPNIDLEERTADGETPLYLACARGTWDIAAELLARGARASAKCTPFQITCLHWIFSFDPAVQLIATRTLIENGCEINAVCSHQVPFFHYPFVLPAGTPLHWAVITSSHTAIQALVENRAELTLRDDCDPYKYDGRVRSLDQFGGQHQSVYSLSDYEERQGLSPLDYAAMFHDPFIFEYLACSKRPININDTDEDGLNVFHRLSGSHFRWTRTENYFSWLPFCGESASMNDQVTRIVKAIKSLGGDMEQLTTPHMANERLATSARAISHLQKRHPLFPLLQSYTPLMMATLGSWPSVVGALLYFDADVATKNDQGNTALHCLPEDPSAATEIGHLIVSAGADVGISNLKGFTALCKAATQGNTELMDLLLSNGADIEETYHLSSIFRGASVFALLAKEDPPFDESRDLKVAQLLEKHVFNHTDVEKRQSVISKRDDDGSTILYHFAGRFMRHSVGALIKHGADINSLTTVHTTRWHRGEPMRLSWQQTPLDRVEDHKNFKTEGMRENVNLTVPEYNSICMRADAVMKLLAAAGGTQVPPRIGITSFTREELFAGGDYIKALRELKM